MESFEALKVKMLLDLVFVDEFDMLFFGYNKDGVGVSYERLLSWYIIWQLIIYKDKLFFLYFLSIQKNFLLFDYKRTLFTFFYESWFILMFRYNKNVWQKQQSASSHLRRNFIRYIIQTRKDTITVDQNWLQMGRCRLET